MKYFLVALALVISTTPLGAQGSRCDPFAPYYHKVQTGPGAMLADLFFFVGSVPIAVASFGGARRNVVSTHGEQARVSTAACLPIATARHFGETRPPHVEHWRAD